MPLPEASRETPPDPEPPRASLRGGLAPIRRLLGFSREDRGALVAIFFLGLLVAGSRYVQMVLVQPLMDGVILPSTAEDFRFEQVRPLLTRIGGIAALTLVASPLAVLGRGYAAEWTAGRVRQRIDVAMARKLLRVPLRVFRERSSGDFLARAMADAQISCQTVALFYREVVVNVQMLAVGLIVLAWISPAMTGAVVLAVPPFLLLANRLMTRVVDFSSRRQETPGQPLRPPDRDPLGHQGDQGLPRRGSVEQNAFDRSRPASTSDSHMKMMKNGSDRESDRAKRCGRSSVSAVLGVGVWAIVYEKSAGSRSARLIAFIAVQSLIMKPLKSLIQAGPPTPRVRRRRAIVSSRSSTSPKTSKTDPTPAHSGLHRTRASDFRDVAFDYHYAAREAARDAGDVDPPRHG